MASKCSFKIKNLRQNKSPCNSRNDILEETLVENLRTFEGFPKQTDDCWTYEGRCCYIHTIPGQNCFIHQEIPYQYICIAVLRNRKLPVKSKRVHSIIPCLNYACNFRCDLWTFCNPEACSISQNMLKRYWFVNLDRGSFVLIELTRNSTTMVQIWLLHWLSYISH